MRYLPDHLQYLSFGASKGEKGVFYDLAYFGVPQGPYGNVWMALALVKGVEYSNHSAILGRSALVREPIDALTSPVGPLDLRAQGRARHTAYKRLIANCFELATSPDSPLRERRRESLSIIFALLDLITRFDHPAERTLELFGIAKEVFEDLYERESTEGRRSLVTKTLSDITKYAAFLALPPLFYVDPLHWTTQNITSFEGSKYEDAYWTACWLIRKQVAILSKVLFSHPTTREREIEEAFRHTFTIIRCLREFRTANFTPTIFKDASSPKLVLYETKRGPEHPSLSLQVDRHAIEDTYGAWYLVSHALDIFPNNQTMRRLQEKLEEWCDDNFTQYLATSAFLAEKDRRSGVEFFRGYFVREVQILGLHEGWKMLARWRDKHPEGRQTLDEIVKLWKHRSFKGRMTADWLNEYEAFLKQNRDETTTLDHFPGILREIQGQNQQ
ncbi:hypothetical protein BT69DRAFT_1304026, partial [Atractiella rhizophila]